MQTRTLRLATAVSFAAHPAFAATDPSDGVTGIILWVFIGYCAIIVVAQTLTAIGKLFGIIRGASGNEPEKVQPSADEP